jgi:hypothetical protein
MLEGNELFSAQEREAAAIRRERLPQTEGPPLSLEGHRAIKVMLELPPNESLAIAAAIIRDRLKLRDRPTREGWCLIDPKLTGRVPVYVRTIRLPSDPERFAGGWEYRSGGIWKPLTVPVVELPIWEECR